MGMSSLAATLKIVIEKDFKTNKDVAVLGLSLALTVISLINTFNLFYYH